MTVIAWDGKTLAADKMASDAWVDRGVITKILSVAGCLIGAAGDSPMCRELIAWFTAGAQPETFPKSIRDAATVPTLLVIALDGTISTYQNAPYPIVWDAGQPFAIGSGKEAALAVMELGFDSRKAVEIASRICTGCGNGIDTLEFEHDDERIAT